VKSLIFGIAGQDGYYLTQFLRAASIDVVGVARRGGPWINGDVSDFALVDAVIRAERPDFIFHFAANSTTRHEALFDNHNAISTGTLNVLESVRRNSPHTKVFLSGSAMQFRNEGLPIYENTPFEARSPYSVARIQSVYAARYYRQAFGLRVYVGYLFNHDSPLRNERHVNQKIVAAVKRIVGGSSEILELGNIEVRKEFNFAADIVEAIWTLVSQDAVFEAVIGSGHAHRIVDWVHYCFSRVGKDWRQHVRISEQFVPEYHVLVSWPRLIESLGWRPKTGFEEFANLMLSA
jgi:GDPmannose 4,6-dehydratase